MPTPQELEQQFWKSLKSDMTMMIGLDGVEDGHARPMTAQIENECGPIWFFTSKDNTIVQMLAAGRGHRAIATFAVKGHEGARARPTYSKRHSQCELCSWRAGGEARTKV